MTGLRVALCVSLAWLGACSYPSAPDSTTPSAPSTPPPVTAPSAIVSAIIDLTNAERAKAGLPSVAANALLIRDAELQAEQVVAFGRLEHTIAEAK